MTQTAESGSDAAAAPAPAAVHGFHGVQYVLHRLWCSLLGRADIAADDDFFAIGGTDGSARELCRRITENLGCDVDFETFRSAPTFEALSVLVRTSSSGTRGGPLLRLQRGVEAERRRIRRRRRAARRRSRRPAAARPHPAPARLPSAR